MRATQLVAVDPAIPSVARSFVAQSSCPDNVNYQDITVDSICTVEQSEIDEFKSYLSTIPFAFTDICPTVAGRILASEADVRLFLDSTVNLAVWPVILAMVPLPEHSDTRGYDLIFGSERNFGVKIRPDDAILKVFVHSHVNMSEPLIFIEFKAPDVLRFCEKIGEIDLSEIDDFGIVSRQVRKYAVEGDVSTVIIMDDAYAIYVHFHNATDENAPVEFLVATLTGDKQKFCRLTVRELVVFAAWKVLKEKGLGVRLYRNSGIRITARDLDYANEIDYSEFGKGSGTNRSSRPDKGKRTTHRFRPYRSPEFKDAAITSNDLTPQKMNDSGYLSIPNTLHRPVNQFFLGPGKPIYFDAEVLMLWDNVGILLSEDEVSSDGEIRVITPPPFKNLVAKFFSHERSFACAREVRAYNLLKPLQGYLIPYCYGLYKSSASPGYVVLLENVPGDTVEDIYDQPTVLLGGVKALFCVCWSTMKRIHACGICHGDIHAGNIIVATDRRSCTFVDWGNADVRNPLAVTSDERKVRRVFRDMGVEETVLKNWVKESLLSS